MRIAIQGFIGEIPRASARLLPENAAQLATNCKLWSRELRPWRDFTTAASLVKTGAMQTIYPLTAASTYWMHWLEDVNAVRGPVAGDTTRRTYFTGSDAPRVTDNVLVNIINKADSLNRTATGNHFKTYTYTTTGHASKAYTFSVWMRLGTLTGSIALRIRDGAGTEVAVVGHTVTGLWARYTATGTFGASPAANIVVFIDPDNNTGSAGDSLHLFGAQLEQAASVSTYVPTTSAPVSPNLLTYSEQFDNAIWVKTNATVTANATDNPVTGLYPMASYLLGVPSPAVAPSVTIGGAGSGTAVNRAYVHTLVTAWGEESAPSPASAIIAVQSGQTVTVAGFSALPVGDYQITLRRFYRVVTGTAGAEYLFVAEQGVATTSYVDSLTDAQLGEVLATTDWLPPPAGLQGLIALPNGVMAGFVGNQVYLSQPYAPYAWPTRYKQVVDFPVVALGNFGSTVVVATSSRPYVVNGVDPAYASPSQYPGLLACTSKRSLVSTEHGVLYASSQGLVLANGSGAELITLGIIDADDWRDLKPATMHAVYYNRMYIAFYATAVVDGLTQGRGFIIEGIGSGNLHLTRLDFYRYGMFLDAETNKLYMIKYDGVTNTVEEWESAGTSKAYSWKSKVFAHAPLCLTAAKVVSNYETVLTAAEIAALQAARNAAVARNAVRLPVGRGAINGGAINAYAINGNDFEPVSVVPVAETTSVEFKLYSNGQLKHTASISSDEPFRLPGGYEGSETEIELSGVAYVQEVVVAQNMSELADS